MGVTTDTRDRMVTSAGLLLREHGVAGTSFSKVLAHSNGPRGSVGFHFPGGKAELLTDALRWASGWVTAMLAAARERGTEPPAVVAAICEHYRVELRATDYRAGCPVGAVAQEGFDDPALGPVVGEILDAWVAALADILVDHGHGPAEAAALATLCLSSVEGAITLARVQRSTAPLDIVAARLVALL